MRRRGRAVRARRARRVRRCEDEGEERLCTWSQERGALPVGEVLQAVALTKATRTCEQ